MRLTPENKSKVRERIVTSAASVLREGGYGQVNLDQLMQAAGLTRGAFYAHFKSKTELFAEIVRREHPLLRLLRDRSGTTAADLWAQMKKIFAKYLAPENLKWVFPGCSVAALTGDVSRSAEPVRLSYELAWNEILSEMARGQQLAQPQKMTAALLLATGAVTSAMASASDGQRSALLEAAHDGFIDLVESAREG